MGGCFETSRPTTFPSPTYEVDGILHMCVPNLPSVAARTATQALTNATPARTCRRWPTTGIDAALRAHPDLAPRAPTSTGAAARARRSPAPSASSGGACPGPRGSADGLDRDLPAQGHLGRGGGEGRPLGRPRVAARRLQQPRGAADGARRPGRRAARRRGHAPPDLRGRRPRGPEVLGLLPPPRPLHRPERPAGGQRGPGRLGAGLPAPRSPASSARGVIPVDVAFIHISPPDEHGFCSYGVGVECTKAAAESAPGGGRPGQPADAAVARGLLHPRLPADPRGGDRPDRSSSCRMVDRGERTSRAPSGRTSPT